MPATHAMAPEPAADPGTRMLDRLEALCRDETTTGREDQGLGALQEQLAALDAHVELHEVAPRRHNVFATWSPTPRLLFTMGERDYLEAECVRSGTLKTYRLDRVQRIVD